MMDRCVHPGLSFNLPALSLAVGGVWGWFCRRAGGVRWSCFLIPSACRARGGRGFGVFAGVPVIARAQRNPARTRPGVSCPGGSGRCQGSRMSAASGRASQSWFQQARRARTEPSTSPIALSPEKRKLVLDTIHWFNQHSLEWAGGGHIPAYLPVQDSAEFKALKPNSDYASLAKTAVFDPVSIYAGVASPVYDAAGNYMIPALNGEIAPADAAKKIRDDLQALAK